MVASLLRISESENICSYISCSIRASIITKFVWWVACDGICSTNLQVLVCTHLTEIFSDSFLPEVLTGADLMCSCIETSCINFLQLTNTFILCSPIKLSITPWASYDLTTVQILKRLYFYTGTWFLYIIIYSLMKYITYFWRIERTSYCVYYVGCFSLLNFDGVLFRGGWDFCD